jgi:BMFP domain-containing protein YqiC
MQSESRLLEDLARVAAGAMGVAQGMREEVEARLKDQFERVLSRMDLVTREEFEVVQAMARAAREAQEELEQRVAALEAAGREPAKPARKSSARKPQGRSAKSKRKT